jgi:hypothetical protein
MADTDSNRIVAFGVRPRTVGLPPLSDAHLEAAARRLCHIRGIDPDQRISHGERPPFGGGPVLALLDSSDAWQLVADEIRSFHEIWCALNTCWLDDTQG